jgi:hypothetical protein
MNTIKPAKLVKKLTLVAETLRVLSDCELGRIVGGEGPNGKSDLVGCPGTMDFRCTSQPCP